MSIKDITTHEDLGKDPDHSRNHIFRCINCGMESSMAPQNLEKREKSGKMLNACINCEENRQAPEDIHRAETEELQEVITRNDTTGQCLHICPDGLCAWLGKMIHENKYSERESCKLASAATEGVYSLEQIRQMYRKSTNFRELETDEKKKKKKKPKGITVDQFLSKFAKLAIQIENNFSTVDQITEFVDSIEEVYCMIADDTLLDCFELITKSMLRIQANVSSAGSDEPRSVTTDI